MPAPESGAVLDVRGLTISFSTYGGRVQAVRGVDFHLNRGEAIAIVGESGSGKSVTSKAVMGILAKNATIEKGDILYGGKDLAKLTEDQFAKIRGRRIGLIFQDPLSALNPIMRIGKQIAEALHMGGACGRGETRERVLALMESVGIPDPAKRYNQYPFQFSGGMRQRIVIAIALANDPEILICDEPTTALDVTIQARILELIIQLKKERNLSIVFITHDLGVVANMADRVYVMYAGRIVETGTTDEIFYEPAHPYTWALLSSIPDMETKEKLQAIRGTPPNMLFPPEGDAFASRNPQAMEIDFKRQPPFFRLSATHCAATWRLHPKAPGSAMPEILSKRIRRMKEEHDAD